MGFAIAMAPCFICKAVFGFNPERVPSMRATPESPREPICKPCITAINAKRQELGLKPHPIYPDAYEPQDDGM